MKSNDQNTSINTFSKKHFREVDNASGIEGVLNRGEILYDTETMTDDIEPVVDVVKLNDFLFEMVERHVKAKTLKRGKKFSKQEWLTEALNEKIEAKIDPVETHTSRFRNITVKYTKQIGKEIAERVDLLKKIKGTYTRNQWYVDAIQEKLNRENDQINQILSEFTK